MVTKTPAFSSFRRESVRVLFQGAVEDPREGLAFQLGIIEGLKGHGLTLSKEF
jgi:hypothetical protein